VTIGKFERHGRNGLPPLIRLPISLRLAVIDPDRESLPAATKVNGAKPSEVMVQE
jgi:hypothetical protein